MPAVTLQTRWASEVDPDQPLPEYPRPQLVRPRWKNLNGRWDASIHAPDAAPRFEDSILVPFPVGSQLSGLDRILQPDEVLAVRRFFGAPVLGPEERLRLHFGAVDWACEIFVNGRLVGSHVGGFDCFHVDITEALVDGGRQEVVVSVTDPSDTGDQPLGKQTLNPIGILYTAVAGIWQTVWLEPVPASCIESVVSSLDLAARTVRITCRTTGAADGTALDVEASAGGVVVAGGAATVRDDAATIDLEVEGLRLWSPDDPFLYDLVARLGDRLDPIDRVESYFGAREIGTSRDGDGHLRLTLNGEPVFHLGLLDQGWWPDGLYTAATDEALAFDIEATRAMGFNTIRKHVKVEPARWYWHADRLGVLVWQDMPSTRSDMAAFVKQLRAGIEPPEMDWEVISPGRDPEGFRAELDAVLDALAPFPSIVVWVPFNESWGQHDTDATLAYVAQRDPTRLVDGPSGWVDTGSGQLRDYHMYRDPEVFPGTEPERPVVYGEYGGLMLVVEGHTWTDQGWGYSTTETPAEFDEAYTALTEVIAGLIPQGLAAAIYTQTTDVEGEINGLLTYDRAEFKLAPERLAEIHQLIFE